MKKDIVKKFAEKCVDEMKQWYWNKELHDKTTDPLIIDDMTSNAISTIRRITSEFDLTSIYSKNEDRLLREKDVIKAVDNHTNDDGTLDDDISCILEEVKGY